tara:strand:+ start:1651 stop:1881 length:231 start_codon:yes stop_codon:yes gene_type:complete
MSDRCRDCGDDVSLGSGKYVNRVSSGDISNGVPVDTWICAECCAIAEQDLQDHMENMGEAPECYDDDDSLDIILWI